MDFPHPTKHEVIAAIRAAFDGVERGAVTLHEADVMDSYGSAEERAAARLLDTDRVWEQVQAEDIERFSSALCFLDAEGFRYYIPAYMVWTLDNETTGASSRNSTLCRLERLGGRDATAAERLKLLDDGQRRAIALFLLYFTPDRYDGDDARKALERFWGRYLPEKYQPDGGGAAR